MKKSKKKHLRSLLTLIILTWCSLIISQTYLSDSLASLLGKDNEIIVYENFFRDLESDDLLLLAKEVDDYRALAWASENSAGQLYADYTKLRLLVSKSEMSDAVSLAEAVLLRMEMEKDSNIDIYIKTKLLLSTSLDAIGNSEKAVKINYELKDLIDKQANESNEFEADLYHYKNYMSLAQHYLFNNDSLSYSYSKKALDYAQDLGDIYILNAFDHGYYSNYFGNDGTLLNRIADSCILYSTKINNPESLGTSFMHKCNALVALGRSDEAEEFCNKAINEFEKSTDPIYLSSVYNNIGNVFKKTDNPKRALPYFEKSVDIAQNLDNGEEYLKSLNNLAEEYLNVGDFEKSAQYFKIYADSQLVYHNSLLSSQFSEAEAKYQSSEKEKEIAIQKLEVANQKAIRNRIILGGSLLLLLGVAFFQWYRNRQRILDRERQFEIDQKEREAEQLREVDKMKTQFFTNVSHELRTPLTLITGPLENILENNTDQHLQKELALAYSNSNKLNHLVTEILDLAKLESGKMRIKPIHVNLHSLVNRLFLTFESYAESKGVELKLENRISKTLNVKLDVGKFETIINNLVSNAIKFSNQGDVVLLDSAVSNESLILYVKDNGVGIPPGDEERVFERFYQTDHNLQKNVGGTGVGLSLSKELIGLLGGRISAENNHDVGATFHLTLPLEVTEEAPAEREEVQTNKETLAYTPILLNGKRPRILVVEDNEDMRQYLSSILNPHFECDFAENGYECLQKIQKENFDLISSDVMMPQMDGFTLKSRINNLDRHKDIPFIFLTARILEDDRIEGLQLGVDDYITKPFNRREYLTRIHNLLANKKERETEGSFEMESVDRRLLKSAEQWVYDHISETNLKVQDLATSLNYSQRQLSRLIKNLTGLTLVNFILEIRLQKAFQMLQRKQFNTVAEVRYEVGIESASYFTKKFNERFGVLPSEVK